MTSGGDSPAAVCASHSRVSALPSCRSSSTSGMATMGTCAELTLAAATGHGDRAAVSSHSLTPQLTRNDKKREKIIVQIIPSSPADLAPRSTLCRGPGAVVAGHSPPPRT